MKKSIYSLPALQQILLATNRRHLQFISAIEDISGGINKLDIIAQTVTEKNRPYKGFNFFSENDQRLFEAIASGVFHQRL